MDEPAFGESGFGQVLQNSDYMKNAMTKDNLTQLDEMVLNKIASDDRILSTVSQTGTTSNPVPEKTGSWSVSKLAEQRWSELDALQQAAEKAKLEGRGEPSWSESDQYDLEFYKAIKDENGRYANVQISDGVNYVATGTSEVSGKEYTSYTKMATFHFGEGEDKVNYVTYAGTGPEVTSWLEDGRMATTQTGVQSQQAAAEYLQAMVDRHEDGQFIVAGYSKGGNEALYASIMLKDKNRLYKVRNFDGPGFGNELLENEEFVGKYNELKERLGDDLYCLSPQNSVIGHLMNNHDSYVYFESANENVGSGMLDHDYKFWKFNPDGSLVTTDADGNPLERTKLSEFYENTLEKLLAILTPEETERFYDVLEKFCVDNNIVYMGELNKIWTKDGKFDLDRLCNTIVNFAASLDAESLEVLTKVVVNTLTTEFIASLGEFFVEYTGKSVGIQWNGLLRAGFGGLTGLVADKTHLALALNVLIAGLIALVVGLSAVYVGIKWVVENAGQIYDKIKLTLHDLGEKFQANLDAVWSKAEQMIQSIKTRLTEVKNGLYQNICEIMEAPNAIEAIKIALRQGKDTVVSAADTLGNIVQNVLSTTLAKIEAGFKAGESLFNNIFDGCLSMLRTAKGYFAQKIGWLSVRYARYVTLDIDINGVQETVALLLKAAGHASKVSGQVGSICAQLTTEGIADAATGNFRTFVSIYHLVIARMQVNHYGEILSMVNKLEDVCSTYESAKNTIRAAMPQLN